MLQLATRLRDCVSENNPSSLQERWDSVTQGQRVLMATDGEDKGSEGGRQHQLLM
jgi:hypothetical protein